MNSFTIYLANSLMDPMHHLNHYRCFNHAHHNCADHRHIYVLLKKFYPDHHHGLHHELTLKLVCTLLVCEFIMLRQIQQDLLQYHHHQTHHIKHNPTHHRRTVTVVAQPSLDTKQKPQDRSIIYSPAVVLR